jgi:hypothetical protein
MAYSNTNKDNLQHDWKKTVKRAILAIILTLILISSVTSIYQQGTILRDAVNRNKLLEKKTSRLQAENELFKKQIEYATSSANVARRTPGDDYRLILPPEDRRAGMKEEVHEVVLKPVIIQWWELFTK